MNLKLNRLAIALTLLSIISLCHAQSVVIQSGIILPKDSIAKEQLVASLNGFLLAKDHSNKENKYVLKEDLLETSALLDEMKGMDKNVKLKDKNYYKCYLTNATRLNDNNFVVQISYIGCAGNTPVLRSSFRLLAKREDGQFYFLSPLKQNAAAWKIKKIGDMTYYYKDTIDLACAEAYQKAVNSDDKRLNAPAYPIEFYCCDNLPEVLQLVGIEYKADYNGLKNETLTSYENKKNLVVNGGTYYNAAFDPHDLWHERLRHVLSYDITNRPVDEGCAYLYGGSWGFTWPEVLAKFKQYAVANPNTDWLKLYTESVKFEDDEKPMYIAYALNALIVQKIEKEKGFAPVMELLGCGKRETGDENYFKALEKVTGISKANFNVSMWELVKAAK